MTLNEQILACARVNGYDGKGTNIIRPKYNSSNHDGYREIGGDMGEWWVENGITRWRVTDENFKQWKRDNLIEQLLEK